ncbi:MAG TPA: hypothetical protein VM802_06955 [Chitinophaga sp.]|uniref:hypothetical protein n=1 Tax=Chitinophaga sp. TaxID=1869181 RepID=UPI002B57B06C|nr:hypothetical protein [Chitinophaga sp.]HVI44589.1 hypothetical protein [Chitinophaga sp.]
MKTVIVLFFTIASYSLYAQEKAVLIQNNVYGDNIQNITNSYKTVVKVIREEQDRFMLLSGIRIAEKASDKALPDSIRNKCTRLFELCDQSLKNPNQYYNNKSVISDLWNEITGYLFVRLKMNVTDSARVVYEQVKIQYFNDQLDSLKSATGSAYRKDALEYFNEILHGEERDTTNIKLLAKEERRFLNAIQEALIVSNDNNTIDKIFQLYPITTKPETKLEEKLRDIFNKALNSQLMTISDYAGDLLTEGYKSYLLREQKFHGPSLGQSKAIYKYIIQVSDSRSISINVMLSQVQLFERGILNCNNKGIREGYNWSAKDKYVQLIPVRTFNSSLKELILSSTLQEKELSDTDLYFSVRAIAISGFFYKLEKFKAMQPEGKWMNSGFHLQIKDLITENPLLIVPAKFDPCTLFAPFSDDKRWR